MSIDLTTFDPPVSPSPDARPFWEAASRHELQIPLCVACKTAFFYPRTLCPACGSRDVGWIVASGRGIVHTFCIQYQSGVPGFASITPFITALVELAEGPRLMTMLIDVDPDPASVHCDMPVEVDFLDLVSGHSLPVFRPV